MIEDVVPCFLIDTSYLRKTKLGDPDFRKLLRYSQEGTIRLLVPYIVWEERRTQLAERTYTRLKAVREEIAALKAPWLGGLVAEGLVPPTLEVCADSEIEVRSREAMTTFAESNKIEIVPLAPDHASRAWKRYFEVGLPFNITQQREERRKDIPDSWIFETAIDLKNQYGSLSAICKDEKLAGALASIGVSVFRETQEVLELIHGKKSIAESPAAPGQGPEATIGKIDENILEHVLARANDRFKGLDKRILGYIGYLGSPSKDQLFDLLKSSGVVPDVARNAAERLVFEGLIKDTGNHYLPENREVCNLAAPLVESEIINLLAGQ